MKCFFKKKNERKKFYIIFFIIISVGFNFWWMRNILRNLRYMISRESVYKFLVMVMDLF